MKPATTSRKRLSQEVAAASWYHSIDLGDGVVTPGIFDHRPFLEQYGIPEDLQGKTVLDIGAASGFFSFEFERRGGRVTAIDLPEWGDHDFGPKYVPDRTSDDAQHYLHKPFEVAHSALASNVQRKLMNVYDIAPETVGRFDLVFSGSMLIHLTDPIRALWNIASVTGEKAIIATSLAKGFADWPMATMIGHQRGDAWWMPTRSCLEVMAATAGFIGIEWVSEFTLDYRDGRPGPYHGVLHAYTTTEGWTSKTIHRDEVIARHSESRLKGGTRDLAAEVDRLRTLVADYEQGRFMRFSRWFRSAFGS